MRRWREACLPLFTLLTFQPSTLYFALVLFFIHKVPIQATSLHAVGLRARSSCTLSDVHIHESHISQSVIDAAAPPLDQISKMVLLAEGQGMHVQGKLALACHLLLEREKGESSPWHRFITQLSTLNPQPSTLNPKHHTLNNPKP